MDDLGGRAVCCPASVETTPGSIICYGNVAASMTTSSREVIHRICRLLFTHAFVAEAVLWPAVRALGDGEALTLRIE
jgi:hypothetical protein